MGKKKNTSKAIKGVVREAVEELAPDIYSMPESQQALADAGVSVGHITEKYTPKNGRPMDKGSIVENMSGSRNFDDLPQAFRSFAAEASGYLWNPEKEEVNKGETFEHGGYSYGVTPRARFSFGGIPGVDFREIQEGYRAKAGGIGAKDLAQETGAPETLLGGLVPPSSAGVGAGVTDSSTFKYDYDGRGSRMSPAELSNALSMEQSSYWMSRVGEEDAVAPLLLGGAGITTPRRKGKKATQDVGVMGSPSEVAVMKFISVFGWIDIRATMLLLGVSTRAHASRILNGLQKSSCLRAVTVPGSRHKVWLATSEGIDLFRIGGKPYEESKVGNSEFQHRVLVGYSGAVLMNGTFDILDIAGALDSGRVPGLVGRGSNGFEIVADRVINSALLREGRGTNRVALKGRLVVERDRLIRQWEGMGGAGISPEFLGSNEWMWAVLDKSSTSAYHVPDVVALAPRGEGSNGRSTPRSVAVEVERGARKDKGHLYEILEQYKNDTSVFGSVVWLCTSDKVVTWVNEWAKGNGVSGRVRALRLRRPDGSVFEGVNSFEY